MPEGRRLLLLLALLPLSKTEEPSEGDVPMPAAAAATALCCSALATGACSVLEGEEKTKCLGPADVATILPPPKVLLMDAAAAALAGRDDIGR